MIFLQPLEHVGIEMDRNVAPAQVVDRRVVRLDLEVPRVLGLDEGGGKAGGEGGDRGDVAGDDGDDEGGAGVLQHVAQGVAVQQVARFMGDDADDFFVVPGKVHQPVGDDDDAGGEGEGVGADLVGGAEFEPHGLAAGEIAGHIPEQTPDFTLPFAGELGGSKDQPVQDRQRFVTQGHLGLGGEGEGDPLGGGGDAVSHQEGDEADGQEEGQEGEGKASFPVLEEPLQPPRQFPRQEAVQGNVAGDFALGAVGKPEGAADGADAGGYPGLPDEIDPVDAGAHDPDPVPFAGDSHVCPGGAFAVMVPAGEACHSATSMPKMSLISSPAGPTSSAGAAVKPARSSTASKARREYR